MSGVNKPSHSLTIAVIVSAGAMVVVATSEFIVIGILPEMARDLGLSLARTGHFVTWYALAAALAGPVLTVWLSRVPAHRLLSAVLVLFAVSNLVIALRLGYAWIAGARVLQGSLLPVFVSIATAAIAQSAGPQQAGRAIANVNIGMVLATVLAMPAGVFIAHVAGWSMSFYLLAGLGLGAALALFAGFPPLATATATPKAQVAILRAPHFLAHLMLSAVLFTGMFAAYTYLAGLLASGAGLDGSRIALAMAWFGLAGLMGNGVAGRVVGRGPTLATGGVALALTGTMLAAVWSLHDLPALALALALWGMAHTAGFVLCHIRTMLAAPLAPAFAGALNLSVANGGIAAGAWVGGVAVERFGIAAAVYAGALLSAVALGMALVMLRRNQ